MDEMSKSPVNEHSWKANHLKKNVNKRTLDKEIWNSNAFQKKQSYEKVHFSEKLQTRTAATITEVKKIKKYL